MGFVGQCGSLENLSQEIVKQQHPIGLVDSPRFVEFDEVSGEEQRENTMFVCFWKGSHESFAIRSKSFVRAHCRQQTN